MELISHMEKVFGADDSGCISRHHINNLLRQSWSGGIPSPALRPLCWRVLLGLISPSDKSVWETELLNMVEKYKKIREKVMPSLDKVKLDPLSAMDTASTNSSDNDEWSIYYKNVDLINFIKTDLDRLYISGIPDEYFEAPHRRDMLLGILLIWSFQHPVISYRQGMHEMAAYVLYCIEIELTAWNSIRVGKDGKPPVDEYSLLNAFNEQNVEAHTYEIFARIMNELEPIYDPVAFTPRGAESQPFVVQFSTKIQEHYLRMLDADLSQHLEDCNVSAQIYGLRWCRLLLGREYTVENDQIYKIWDYIFACCYEAENVSAEALLDADMRPNINSLLATVRIAGHNQHSNLQRRNITSMGTVKHESPNESSAPDIPQYVCTPLLGALGDVMLAMLLHIRDPLMEGDSSSVLGYLMHYPEMPTVTPILDYADMIKRGVIMGPPEKKPSNNKNSNHRKPNTHLRVNHQQQQLSGPANSSPNGNIWNLQSMKQRMAAGFSHVTMAMGNGITEIVNNLAEYGDDEEISPTSSSISTQSNSLHDTSKQYNYNNSTSTSTSSQSNVNLSKPVVTSQPAAGNNAKDTTRLSEHAKIIYPSDSSEKSSASVTASIAEQLVPPISVPSATAVPQSSVALSRASADSAFSAEGSVSTLPPPSTPHSSGADPLTGLLNQPTTTVLSAAPSSPVLTGKGTDYKNMPNTVLRPDDRDSSSSHHHINNNNTAPVDNVLSSPSITGYNIRNKIFNKGKGWFPSSSKKNRQIKRERSSGGVDLHILHSSQKQMQTKGGGEADSGSGTDSDQINELKTVSKPKNGSVVDSNAVGDRLLDLADLLVHPPYTSLPATITEGRELEYEADIRRDTVKKLRAMADVLAGLLSLEGYDAKFGASSNISTRYSNLNDNPNPDVNAGECAGDYGEGGDTEDNVANDFSVVGLNISSSSSPSTPKRVPLASAVSPLPAVAEESTTENKHQRVEPTLPTATATASDLEKKNEEVRLEEPAIDELKVPSLASLGSFGKMKKIKKGKSNSNNSDNSDCEGSDASSGDNEYQF